MIERARQHMARWWLAPVAALAMMAVLAISGPVRAGDRIPPPQPPPPVGPLLEGADAEEFLRTAIVVSRKPIGEGVTRSEKLTLTDGKRSARAAWKTIDERVMGLSHMDNGNVEFDFRDSWKHDVAAYELDKLLGLGLVPPTVERQIGKRRGSLQLWVEDAISELDRRQRNLQPPDVASWNERRVAIRFLRELVYDTDYNIHNTLYGPGFRVWAIDFSRAFRIATRLLSPERLHRLPPPPVLDRLRALDQATLEARLSPWLQHRQINGLLARRDAILALAEKQKTPTPLPVAAEPTEP